MNIYVAVVVECEWAMFVSLTNLEMNDKSCKAVSCKITSIQNNEVRNLVQGLKS